MKIEHKSMYNKDISVIIPHRNSVDYLPKLLSSIPNIQQIEIIIVDNSPIKINKDEIRTDRTFCLLYSDPERGAGGARNVGIEYSTGKWLVFADADDYFTEGAFEVFLSNVNSDSEIIYTGMGGIYLDTGKPSDRGDGYTKLVRSYLSSDTKDDKDLRLTFSTPCCKMVSHDLVVRHNLRYDEVIASNDMYFSLTSGFYAKSIDAVDYITYIATVSKGSLTKRYDYAARRARYGVYLRYNAFVKEHGLSQYQRSVMIYLTEFIRMSPVKFFEAIWMLVKYRQNPFIGCGNWIKTASKKDVDKRYKTK